MPRTIGITKPSKSGVQDHDVSHTVCHSETRKATQQPCSRRRQPEPPRPAVIGMMCPEDLFDDVRRGNSTKNKSAAAPPPPPTTSNSDDVDDPFALRSGDSHVRPPSFAESFVRYAGRGRFLLPITDGFRRMYTRFVVVGRVIAVTPVLSKVERRSSTRSCGGGNTSGSSSCTSSDGADPLSPCLLSDDDDDDAEEADAIPLASLRPTATASVVVPSHHNLSARFRLCTTTTTSSSKNYRDQADTTTAHTTTKRHSLPSSRLQRHDAVKKRNRGSGVAGMELAAASMSDRRDVTLWRKKGRRFSLLLITDGSGLALVRLHHPTSVPRLPPPDGDVVTTTAAAASLRYSSSDDEAMLRHHASVTTPVVVNSNITAGMYIEVVGQPLWRGEAIEAVKERFVKELPPSTLEQQRITLDDVRCVLDVPLLHTKGVNHRQQKSAVANSRSAGGSLKVKGGGLGCCAVIHCGGGGRETDLTDPLCLMTTRSPQQSEGPPQPPAWFETPFCRPLKCSNQLLLHLLSVAHVSVKLAADRAAAEEARFRAYEAATRVVDVYDTTDEPQPQEPQADDDADTTGEEMGEGGPGDVYMYDDHHYLLPPNPRGVTEEDMSHRTNDQQRGGRQPPFDVDTSRDSRKSNGRQDDPQPRKELPGTRTVSKVDCTLDELLGRFAYQGETPGCSAVTDPASSCSLPPSTPSWRPKSSTPSSTACLTGAEDNDWNWNTSRLASHLWPQTSDDRLFQTLDPVVQRQCSPQSQNYAAYDLFPSARRASPLATVRPTSSRAPPGGCHSYVHALCPEGKTLWTAAPSLSLPTSGPPPPPMSTVALWQFSPPALLLPASQQQQQQRQPCTFIPPHPHSLPYLTRYPSPYPEGTSHRFPSPTASLPHTFSGGGNVNRGRFAALPSISRSSQLPFAFLDA